jgi:hypothetical protein
MRYIKLFEQFLLEEDGFGRDFFAKKKDGKVSKYFFKIEGEEETLGFIINIGKLSRGSSIDEAENSYSVISSEPIRVSTLDDYLVNETDYKSREDEEFSLTKSEFMRFYKILSESIKDYLQNNPKVSKMYDEIPLNLDMELSEYQDRVESLMDEWSYEKWSVQDGSSERTLMYTRRDHD